MFNYQECTNQLESMSDIFGKRYSEVAYSGLWFNIDCFTYILIVPEVVCTVLFLTITLCLVKILWIKNNSVANHRYPVCLLQLSNGNTHMCILILETWLWNVVYDCLSTNRVINIKCLICVTTSKSRIVGTWNISTPTSHIVLI